MHKILLESGDAVKQPKKSRRRKWVRYERTYSNSLWHTDFKLLDSKKWFVSYQDDASRLITGWGVFDEATGEHALEVLDKAIARYGRPAAVMSDHGAQFYANEKEARKRGASAFEKRLVELGIRHILSGIRHPQTNGKLERFHGELQRKLHVFEKSSISAATRTIPGQDGSHVGGPFAAVRETDPVERFVRWYNEDRAHMSLDWDRHETPAQAFVRKSPPRGKIVIDEETGEEYDVK